MSLASGVGRGGVPVERTLRRGLSLDNWLLVVAAGALFVLVAYPLLWLIISAFGEEGAFTLDHLRDAFVRPELFGALVNTLVIAVLVALLSVLIGVPAAWLVARSDIPFPRTIEALVYACFIYPSFLTAIAYVVLLGPGAGILNRWLVSWLGLDRSPFNIFSISGIVFVTALHVYPFVFLMTVNSLRSINPSLEAAAQMLGASRWTVVRRIVLPLAAPAILAGALLAFVDSIALFGIQAILGIPRSIHTLPTRIYALFSYPPQLGLAASMSLMLAVIAALAFYLQQKVLGARGYVTVTGKGARRSQVALGRWRYPALGLLAVLFTLALVLPSITLVGASFMRSLARGFTAANMTLRNYEQLLDGVALRAIGNSIVLSAAAATLAVCVGLLVAYLNLRTRQPGRRILDYLALLPLGLPGIVLAVAMIQAWIRPPLLLYGTIWILLVAYITRFVPFTVRTASTSLMQVDQSLERAARIIGANWATTVWRITVPLVKFGLISGWLLVFIQAMRELSASILLYSAGNETLAIVIYRFYDEGYFPMACAMATVTLLITMIAVAAARSIGARTG